MAPAVEKAMVDSGIILLKYWLEVSADEQTRRLESRINDPRKIWKLLGHGPRSPTAAGTTTPGPGTPCSRPPTPPWAPWYVAHTDDKKRGRLNIISHLLSQVPYEPLPRPGRRSCRSARRPATTREPILPLRHIPTPF